MQIVSFFQRTGLVLAAVGVFAGCSCLLPQRNLSFIKKDLVHYHDDGCYITGQERVTHSAIRWIKQRSQNAQPSEKLAMVFDVDETSLSNWPYIMAYDFGYNKPTSQAWVREVRCPVISPTKRLYDVAVEQNIAVIFISGRPEVLRSFTEKNLTKVGYTKYARLFMTPNHYKNASLIPYKSSARRFMTAQGYKIIANIGDQWSDLKGGYSERTYKLPNPFYFIP